MKNFPGLARWMVLLSAGALLAPALAMADPLHSLKIGTTDLISPSAAVTFYGSATTSTVSVPGAGTPVEITEMARALGNDVDRIYDFVRNNIEVVWIYGAQKGALGALIDRAGTPFDQTMLMVELLRAAQYTAAYQIGTRQLTATQFSDWTGITSATAACQLLAAGGIPAAVNGSTSATCAYGAQTVTSVELRHIWAKVTIAGTDYLFDPSLKAHSFKAGVALATVAQLTPGTGEVLTAAGGTTGTENSVPYVVGLNGAGALDTKLNTYATNLLNHINSTPALLAGRLDDLVGGAEIVRGDLTASLRQTAFTPAPTNVVTWTGNVPNQYRTSLRVQLTRGSVYDGSYPEIHNVTLYADEIYGRKLIYDSSFERYHFDGSLKLLSEAGFGTVLSTYSNTFYPEAGTLRHENPRYSHGDLTLTVNHPYAAGSGSYMDAVAIKHVWYAVPFTIVHGWGDTRGGLMKKWSSRTDSLFPIGPIPGGCEQCVGSYRTGKGDARREQMAASWLTQSSLAAHLHADIAKSKFAHHHSIGIVSGDTYTDTGYLNSAQQQPDYTYSVGDNFDRVDIDSAISLTSTSANAVDRRAALQAISASIEALEGSVVAQITDLPDTSSTATRFEWGNKPPAGEDSRGGNAARRFFQFSGSTTANAVSPLIRMEGQTTSTQSNGQQTMSICVVEGAHQEQLQGRVASTVADYANAGFTVTASGESFLGPGDVCGAFITPLPVNDPDANPYNMASKRRPTFQRGGALVATKYVAGEPVEIAHVLVGYDHNLKGGGGGAQLYHESQYDPAKSADILKSRFVDRGSVLGIDLKTGTLSYSSPASLKVGTGDFPYQLSAQLIWRGGLQPTDTFGAISYSEPLTPWTTNWHNTLSLSGSGIEMMGSGDIRATAGTVAAFLAAQDLYKSPLSAQRDVAAVLVQGWWARQLAANVVTANVGAGTRQFVKLFNGSWIAPGSGPTASLAVTGQRQKIKEQPCSSGSGIYVITRGWDDSGLGFALTNANGDTQNFQYWQHFAGDSTQPSYCAKRHGFRLANWSFPQNVTLNFVYGVDNSQNPDLLPALTEVNNSLSRKITFSYDPVFGYLTGMSNGLSGGDGRSVAIDDERDASNSPLWSTHTDPAGKITRFDYQILPWNGRSYGVQAYQVLQKVTTADNPAAPNLIYTYDALRRVSQVQDGVAIQIGGRNPYQFLIAEGWRGQRIDPADGRYTAYYDRDGQPFRIEDEIGRVTLLDQDGRGRRTQIVYPEGDQEWLEYDGRNNPTKLTQIAKPGSGLANRVIEASWNSTWNKPDWIKNARGYQTDFAYYASGNGKSLLQTATLPAPEVGQSRPVYTFTYNSVGLPADVTDPTGWLNRSSYDTATGNLLSRIVDPGTSPHLNAITSFAGYDAQGDAGQVVDPRGSCVSTGFDAARRPLLVRHHDGGCSANVLAAERTTYDDVGRPRLQEAGKTFSGTSVTAWETTATKTYTPTGKPATETDGDNRTTSYSYDPLDRPQIVTDALNRKTRTEYDLAGQKLKEIRGWGSAREIDYASYGYTANGQVDWVRDARNNLTDYTYDGFDRLWRTCFPGTGNCATTPTGSPALYEERSYDPQGNLLSQRTRSGQTLSSTYDALDRLKTHSLPGVPSGTKTTTWTRDAAGRLELLSDTDGFIVDPVYNTTTKRLSSIVHTLPGLSAKTLGYQFDAAGNRTRISWPDAYTADYGYDSLGRLSTVKENNTTTLATYSYDYRSRRTQLSYGNGAVVGTPTYSIAGDLQTLSHNLAGTTSDVTYSFSYSPAHQIQSVGVDKHPFLNPALGATTESYGAANALNQYPTQQGTALGYDNNGNLTSDGTFSYVYDAENRLRSVSGATTASYDYNPLDQRAKKTVNGSSTYFLTDIDDQEIAEYDSSGNLQRRYIPGGGTDDPIAQVAANGTRSYFHEAITGSVVGMSDGSGNLSEGPYTYGAYGQGAPTTGIAFKYTGRRLDPETGLYYYRARYYWPGGGRFLQTDLIGYQDDLNLYAYVTNDPLNNADPSGLCFENCGTLEQLRENANRRAEPAEVAAVAGVVVGAAALAVTKNSRTAAAVGKAVDKVVEGALKSPSGKTLESKAGELVAKNGGKNSVTMASETGKSRVDLAGKSHYSKETGAEVPTPHVQDYKANIIPSGPRAGEVGSYSKAGDVRPASMEDLNKVEDFLKSLSP